MHLNADSGGGSDTTESSKNPLNIKWKTEQNITLTCQKGLLEEMDLASKINAINKLFKKQKKEGRLRQSPMTCSMLN